MVSTQPIIQLIFYKSTPRISLSELNSRVLTAICAFSQMNSTDIKAHSLQDT